MGSLRTRFSGTHIITTLVFLLRCNHEVLQGTVARYLARSVYLAQGPANVPDPYETRVQGSVNHHAIFRCEILTGIFAICDSNLQFK